MELGLDTDDSLRDSTIKISGCPNSCGQHEIATIGFFGGASRIGTAMAPTYTMLFGWKRRGTGRIRQGNNASTSKACHRYNSQDNRNIQDNEH